MMADFHNPPIMNITFEQDIAESLDNSTTVEISEDDPMSPLETVSTTVILSIIIIIIIIGNVFVIVAVFTYRPLRTVQNMFIVSLAAADITVAVFVMPLNVAYMMSPTWKFGLPICKMWLTCDVMCCTASILHLCVIALDRYWAIHDPINYASKRTLKRVLIMIASIWVVSFIISAPPLLGWNDWPQEFTEDTPCMRCMLTEEKGYVIYSSSGSFYIPLVIMIVVYVKIYDAIKVRLRNKAKAAGKLASVKQNDDTHLAPPLESTHSEISSCAAAEESTSSTVDKISDEKIVVLPQAEKVATTEMTSDNNPTVETVKPKGRTIIPEGIQRLTSSVRSFIKQKQKVCFRKERRAARVLGIVMGVFIVCWLPFFLMYVILPFCPNCYVSKRVVDFITWLGYVNSALNPVIYTAFNTEFRKAFVQLLCRNS